MNQIALITFALALFATVVPDVKAKGVKLKRQRGPRIQEKCEVGGKNRICYDRICYKKDKNCYELERCREHEKIIPLFEQALKSHEGSRNLEPVKNSSPLRSLFRLKNPGKTPEILELRGAVGKLPKLKQLYFTAFRTTDGRAYRGIFAETNEGRGWTDGHFRELKPKRQVERQCIGKTSSMICYSLVFLPELNKFTSILKEALKSNKATSQLEPAYILKLQRLKDPNKDIPNILKVRADLDELPELKQMYYVVFLAKDGAYQGSFAETKEGKGYADQPFTKVLTKEAKLEKTHELLSKKDYISLFTLWRHFCISSRPLPKMKNGLDWCRDMEKRRVTRRKMKKS